MHAFCACLIRDAPAFGRVRPAVRETGKIAPQKILAYIVTFLIHDSDGYLSPYFLWTSPLQILANFQRKLLSIKVIFSIFAYLTVGYFYSSPLLSLFGLILLGVYGIEKVNCKVRNKHFTIILACVLIIIMVYMQLKYYGEWLGKEKDGEEIEKGEREREGSFGFLEWRFLDSCLGLLL